MPKSDFIMILVDSSWNHFFKLKVNAYEASCSLSSSLVTGDQGANL